MNFEKTGARNDFAGSGQQQFNPLTDIPSLRLLWDSRPRMEVWETESPHC
jgi:hypothetical protein